MKRHKPLRRFTPLRAKSKLRRSKSRINYRKRFWAIFSEYIRRSYSDSNGMVKCVTCDNVAHWKEMDAGHYIPKSLGLAVYFEEKNVHPQCSGCNRFRHGNQTKYALYLLKTYGNDVLHALDALQRTTRKIPEYEYLELIDAYKRKLDALETRQAA